MASLPLEAVNAAFGPHSDLYQDVLGVKPNASTEQIQNAYFQRRNSLFQVLAELEAATELDSSNAGDRFQAEREMDAVVITLRILGDATSRAQYDDIRVERVGNADSSKEAENEEPSPVPEPSTPKSVLKKSTYHISVIESANEESATEVVSDATAVDSSPERKPKTTALKFGPGTKSQPKRNAKRKPRRVSPDQPRKSTESRKGSKNQKRNESLNESLISESDVGSLASEVSFRTLRTMETSLTAYEQNRGCFQTIQDEVMGALDDTSRSVYQVCSVFTLRESEIDAVAGRIEKARRQMVHSFKK